MEPLFLLDGLTYQRCDCPPQGGECPQGMERRMQMTEMTRCLVPVEVPPGGALVRILGGEGSQLR